MSEKWSKKAIIVSQPAERFESDTKRFYVEGLKIKARCPKCDREYSKNFGDEYLSYPTFNEEFGLDFNCYFAQSEGFEGEDLGEGCDEFYVNVKLNLSMEIVE